MVKARQRKEIAAWKLLEQMSLLNGENMRSASITLAALAALLVLDISQATADVLITVNKSDQQMTVEVDGVERWNWPVSTGRLDHDTPSGTFKAIWMDADHVSREWDNAPMPYSIFFTESGHAIHGTSNTQKLGSPASHGCVRLAPQNAEKLYSLVREYGMAKTKVVLTGDMQLSLSVRTQPGAKRRASGSKNITEVRSHPDQQISVQPRMRYAISQTFGDFQPDISYDRFR
jgi:hypothetical protein